MTITLLHTADVHRATFDGLRDQYAPDMRLAHIVRPDFLARASQGVTADLIAEIEEVINGISGPVVCTCTTLGPIVTRFGASRADSPMMAAAAQASGDILLVYTVAATRGSSLELLEEHLHAADRGATVHCLALTEFWPLFEAGQHEAFHAAIAAGVKEALKTLPDVGTVVLAQGSMAGAAPLLSASPQNVLTLPETAIRHIMSLG